jgi:hypothetical protein
MHCFSNVKEILMKRTIAFLSLMLVFTVVAFGQTSQLKSLKAACCSTCCAAGCGDGCCPGGCPDDCGSCCQGK